METTLAGRVCFQRAQTGDATELKASLRDQIILPARRAHYPDPDYLLFGQELRGWLQKHLV